MTMPRRAAIPTTEYTHIGSGRTSVPIKVVVVEVLAWSPMTLLVKVSEAEVVEVMGSVAGVVVVTLSMEALEAELVEVMGIVAGVVVVIPLQPGFDEVRDIIVLIGMLGVPAQRSLESYCGSESGSHGLKLSKISLH